jgi:hypothetical protein
MDLEGNLILDREPTRRWVSVIAVIIPVLACVAGVTWFVRAFVSPPTIAIPGSMVLATAQPTPVAPPMRAEPRAPEPAPPQAAAVQPAAPPYSSSLPMVATLSAAPPSTKPPNAPAAFSTPTAFADPARDGPVVMSTAIEAAAPIAGPIPLPRPRPEMTAAMTEHAVPMPRSRPAEEAAPPISGPQPAYNRHAIE